MRAKNSKKPYGIEELGDPYDRIERVWPVFLDTNTEGNVVRLLIKENWYSIAEAIYSHYNMIREFTSVSIAGIDFPEIPTISISLGGFGFRILLLQILIRFVAWAVKKGIELVESTLFVSGMGKPRRAIGPVGEVLYEEC
ncbi:hypothetical protein [Halorubrum distributum]|uniref:Uncharacterized protein n=1 Tax=Halorubrum distributum TaxID=29283 RepID=A0A6B1IXT7_9EURY|nr:hypothetical protein [Halorubrum terrestre]MYL68115.1 hypothetical protein [Halorubrum terrestre]